MNEKLLICWGSLEEGSQEERLIGQLKQSFQDKKIKQLIKHAKSLYKTDTPEQQPSTYSFSVVHDDIPVDKDSDFQPVKTEGLVIYEGKGNDYKEFLVAVNTMLTLIQSSAEKCIFIIKIAAELKYVNREVGARFIDDLAEEVFLYSKKKK
ncbi:hypothetical protein [Pseudobacillus wudalianchiensis]|uniref:Uncharacterized protein n=1 Tax=Pseudobacillus wudalianchiensis TaxID=1743143 RepID=A0A1B9B723_9BACI|nr:hypothetical protein [Bacillus wudalianchiensis]OCA91859.1 hypothetical protein A8F95_19190 [Bacillus wudalianchiensis]